MATTPPVSTTVMVPSTPRHGVIYDFDSHESPLRRSARLLSRKILRDTTPTGPNASQRPSIDSTSKPPSPVPAAKKTPCASRALSPTPDSPVRRNFIKRSIAKSESMHYPAKTSISASHTASQKSGNDASAGLNSDPNPLLAQTTLTASMLPTPAKTPRRKKIPLDFDSTARVLFPPRAADTEMPPPKRMKGNGLDDCVRVFSRSRKQKTIDFFVDSRDQIPDVNKSEGNPFIVHSDDDEEEDERFPASPSTAAQHKKSKQEKSNRTREPVVRKSLHREDGMLYVFRGKKFFRKFDEEEDEEEDDLESLLDDLDEDIAAIKPLSRSSIKPKVLFCTKQEREASTPEAAIRTPSPKPETQENLPTSPTVKSKPVPDTPEPDDEASCVREPTPESNEEEFMKESNEVTNDSPITTTPAVTSSEQPQEGPPQAPRSLRPRGIKAYLNPIKSVEKSKPTRSEIREHLKEEKPEPSTPATRTLRSRVVEGSEVKSQQAAPAKKGKSPFDSWRRTKSSATTPSPALSKLRKRTATAVSVEPADDPAAQKKARSK
ncbi:hypothetical protein KEM54_001261 [Ascosphaera aggregata]|nr:hypothetical protein KEM54_001261 [Ascosphaera aggregata]